MFVHLLRHGVAADASPTGTDDDRPLTDDGREKLRKAAPAYRRMLHEGLDRVVASPLLRARQTAQIVFESCSLEKEGVAAIETDDRLVHAVPAAVPISEIVEPALHDGCEGLLLVGHEPQLGAVFGKLVTGLDVSVPLGKGMLVGIELEGRTSLVGRVRYSLRSREARRLS